mgnify:CR=1 FL=1
MGEQGKGIQDGRKSLGTVWIVSANRLMAETMLAVLRRRFKCGRDSRIYPSIASIPNTDMSSPPELLLLEWMFTREPSTEPLTRLSGKMPETKILVISSESNAVLVRRCLRAGASGYLCSHESDQDSLFMAIRGVCEGECFVPMNLRQKLLNGDSTPDKTTAQLSPREQEVLGYVAAGCSNIQIAKCLGISARTVESHKENLKNKLNAESNFALGRIAREWSN